MQSLAIYLTGCLFLAVSTQMADCSAIERHHAAAPFSMAEVQVLRSLADGILSELEVDADYQSAASVVASPDGVSAPGSSPFKRRASKRNSELLNSLLGLPKNILKSGRK